MHSKEGKSGLKGMLAKMMYGKKKKGKMVKKAKKFVDEEMAEEE